MYMHVPLGTLAQKMPELDGPPNCRPAILASKRSHAPATPAALAGISIASDTAAQEVEVQTDAVGDGHWPVKSTNICIGCV